MSARPLNLIGQEVKKLRLAKGWTQGALAERLQIAGWDISRISVAKLELQVRRVPDVEVLFLAEALGVSTDKLFGGKIKLAEIGPTFRRALGKDDREQPRKGN